ncbi:uncharacterized protein B0I36DRAFT_369282 [Microdochium trichocladiopsis]|uniref:Uncharacterized protein n=1 Tax=Microdochium trichocladiopsis TaxID=1682393 RepID=A0A9P9BLP7_9PEZI|nr:uncharacterized protein B0I36DRAFT_369282 [Microdochium trichocladiopsis]KAH7014312.1 hypothetical protein B0I36DRAFT_369282 [Microdochium trichocladiopsis]
MARVAAQKTALPHNHPLHRPLKKRQAEACQRIHALWGVWPWELLIPVAMYERSSSSNTTTSSSSKSPHQYDLEHPQDWSDNILDTLRKLALSTTLQHAIVRIGYHAALLKVSRLSVRLAKAVTTECEVERERTPPNPKAGSGPIVNRRNKKSSLSAAGSPEGPEAAPRESRAGVTGLRHGSDPSRSLPSMPLSSRRRTDPETMVMHLMSPRSSTPPSEGGARSPDARGLYSGSMTDRYQQQQQQQHRHSVAQHDASPPRGSYRDWPGLVLPNLHEAGLQHKPHSGPRQPALSPITTTATGLTTPLSEDGPPGSHPGQIVPRSSPFAFSKCSPTSPRQMTTVDDLRKRKTSPTIRDAQASGLDNSVNNLHLDCPSSRHHLSRQEQHAVEHTLVKRQKRTLLPGFVQLPAPRVELTPPTSPTSPSSLPSLQLPAIMRSSSTSPSLSSPPSSATTVTSSSFSSSSSCSTPSYPAYTAAAAAIATLQRAHSMESHKTQHHPEIARPQLPPIKTSSSSSLEPQEAVRLPPMLPSGAAAHQRHHSYHCPSTQTAKRTSPPAPSPSSLPSLTRPPLPGRSVSSYASTTLPSGSDGRMNLAFLI